MTKTDIIGQVANTGFSKKDSYELVEALFDVIADALESSGKLKISGFGNDSPRI